MKEMSISFTILTTMAQEICIAYEFLIMKRQINIHRILNILYVQSVVACQHIFNLQNWPKTHLLLDVAKVRKVDAALHITSIEVLVT